MAGNWHGSNGNQIQIQDGTGKFVLIFTEPNGQKVRHPAQWVKPGEEFSWTDKNNGHHVARYEGSHKPVRIRDVSDAWPDSPGYWYR